MLGDLALPIGDPCLGSYPHPKISMRIATRTRPVKASTANVGKTNPNDNPGVTFSDEATTSSVTPGRHGFPTGPLASRLRKAGGGPVDNPATAVHHLQTRLLCSENRSHFFSSLRLRRRATSCQP